MVAPLYTLNNDTLWEAIKAVRGANASWNVSSSLDRAPRLSPEQLKTLEQSGLMVWTEQGYQFNLERYKNKDGEMTPELAAELARDLTEAYKLAGGKLYKNSKNDPFVKTMMHMATAVAAASNGQVSTNRADFEGLSKAMDRAFSGQSNNQVLGGDSPIFTEWTPGKAGVIEISNATNFAENNTLRNVAAAPKQAQPEVMMG